MTYFDCRRRTFVTPVDVCLRMKSFRKETKANYSIVCATQISVGSTLHGLLFGSVIRVLDYTGFDGSVPGDQGQYSSTRFFTLYFFRHSGLSSTWSCIEVCSIQDPYVFYVSHCELYVFYSVYIYDVSTHIRNLNWGRQTIWGCDSNVAFDKLL